MDWAPAVLEPVQLSVPLFVPLGTVLEIVKSPLNRKMKTIKNENCQLQQSPQALSNGAHPDATYGGIKDAVTIPSAEKEVPVTEEHVDGLTTSQVHHDDLLSSCELTKKISGKTCPFPGSLPHGSWTCEMQEIPIHGISFLDEDAQSYPGELGYFWPAIYSTFLHLFQNIIRMNFDEITSSSSMPP